MYELSQQHGSRMPTILIRTAQATPSSDESHTYGERLKRHHAVITLNELLQTQPLTLDQPDFRPAQPTAVVIRTPWATPDDAGGQGVSLMALAAAGGASALALRYLSTHGWLRSSKRLSQDHR
jgi:hypothetical protein